MAKKPTPAAAETPAAAQPDALTLTGAIPLYTDPRPVTVATHRDHVILPGPDDYSFAARTALVPITVDEFAAAVIDYPIVFFGPERRAFIVTGLTADRNLFVNEDGSYAAGAYIPAYLRRYPFAFARDAEDRLRILCLDEASPRVGTASADGARPLFDGDAPSELTRHALSFCEEMHGAEERTAMLVAALDGAELLQPRQAHQNTADTSTLLLDYLAVDADALAALGDDVFTELRRTGALPATYAHVLSAANWTKLQARAAREA